MWGINRQPRLKALSKFVVELNVGLSEIQGAAVKFTFILVSRERGYVFYVFGGFPVLGNDWAFSFYCRVMHFSTKLRIIFDSLLQTTTTNHLYICRRFNG